MLCHTYVVIAHVADVCEYREVGRSQTETGNGRVMDIRWSSNLPSCLHDWLSRVALCMWSRAAGPQDDCRVVLNIHIMMWDIPEMTMHCRPVRMVTMVMKNAMPSISCRKDLRPPRNARQISRRAARLRHTIALRFLRCLEFVFLDQAVCSAQWSADRLYTPGNLWSFQIYCQFYAMKHEIEFLARLPLVLHDESWDMNARAGISVTSRYGSWMIPETQCTQEHCERCLKLAGGYKVCWIGPWTPKGAWINEDETPDDVFRRCTRPWPDGILEPPRPMPA